MTSAYGIMEYVEHIFMYIDNELGFIERKMKN